MSEPRVKPSEIVLQAKGLVKTFEDVGRKVEVLRGVELTVAKGDRTAIVGTSGSGKTTLLQLLGEPTANDRRGASMTRERRRARPLAQPRARFVYQFHHPSGVHGAQERRDAAAQRGSRRRTPRAKTAVARARGLANSSTTRPGELGPERQARRLRARSSLAGGRAADEPTAIDRPTASGVFEPCSSSTWRSAQLVWSRTTRIWRTHGSRVRAQDGVLQPLPVKTARADRRDRGRLAARHLVRAPGAAATGALWCVPAALRGAAALRSARTRWLVFVLLGFG
jgi:lipoprotein-releasing system ATP-binding protein